MAKARDRKKPEQEPEPYIPCDYDASQFTEDEIWQMREWRDRFDSEHDELLEPQLKRLEFIKWLADNHVISEYPD